LRREGFSRASAPRKITTLAGFALRRPTNPIAGARSCSTAAGTGRWGRAKHFSSPRNLKEARKPRDPRRGHARPLLYGDCGQTACVRSGPSPLTIAADVSRSMICGPRPANILVGGRNFSAIESPDSGPGLPARNGSSISIVVFDRGPADPALEPYCVTARQDSSIRAGKPPDEQWSARRRRERSPILACGLRRKASAHGAVLLRTIKRSADDEIRPADIKGVGRGAHPKRSKHSGIGCHGYFCSAPWARTGTALSLLGAGLTAQVTNDILWPQPSPGGTQALRIPEPGHCPRQV